MHSVEQSISVCHDPMTAFIFCFCDADLLSTDMPAIRGGIPLVLSDYNSNTKSFLDDAAEVLDLYSILLLTVLGFPIKKFPEIAKSGNGKIPPDCVTYLHLKLLPHLMTISSLRNDLMAMTISECTEERILFVGGMFHTKDIADRLCGDIEITNPFKSVTEKNVELKQMVPHHYAGHSKVRLTEAPLREALGDDAMELLKMSEEEVQERLRSKLTDSFKLPSKLKVY